MNYFWLRLVTRTSITRNARRSLVHPPSQQTRHSPKRELIVTGVFKRRNLVSRRMRATFMAQERRTVKASAVRNRPASDVTGGDITGGPKQETPKMFVPGSAGHCRSSRTEALRRVFGPLVEEMASRAADALGEPKNHFYG